VTTGLRPEPRWWTPLVVPDGRLRQGWWAALLRSMNRKPQILVNAIILSSIGFVILMVSSLVARSEPALRGRWP
jgi:hypothetical protein